MFIGSHGYRLSLIFPCLSASGLSSGCAKGELRNYLISCLVELDFIGMGLLFPLIVTHLVKFLDSLLKDATNTVLINILVSLSLEVSSFKELSSLASVQKRS